MQNDVKNCEPQLHFGIIDQIMQIPQMIIAGHHTGELVDLVLHGIANDRCLGFAKAAYLVDNPDFNTCKGISGYSKDCSIDEQQDLLEQLKQSSYNRKVKQFVCDSFKAKNGELSNGENLQQLAQQLEMKNPQVHCWNLKHNNYGILLFENAGSGCCDWKKTLVEKATNLLGMCAF